VARLAWGHPRERYLRGTVIGWEGTLEYEPNPKHKEPGRWHGFPVDWRRVPPKLRTAWLASGLVSKRSVKENW
jgi:hypothetical protein